MAKRRPLLSVAGKARQAGKPHDPWRRRPAGKVEQFVSVVVIRDLSSSGNKAPVGFGT